MRPQKGGILRAPSLVFEMPTEHPQRYGFQMHEEEVPFAAKLVRSRR